MAAPWWVRPIYTLRLENAEHGLALAAVTDAPSNGEKLPLENQADGQTISCRG